MFRYSVRTSRARIDVNSIDIVEALIAILRIHRPNVEIASHASNDVMALVNNSIDCDIYREDELVLTLGPNKEKRMIENE